MSDPHVLTFTIPALPPRPLWPNRAKPGTGWEARRWHGYRAKLKEEYSWVVAAACRKAVQDYGWDMWKPFERCTLSLTFIVPTRRSYDSDNLLSAFKSGQDAMVVCGVLRKDSSDCIVSTTVSTYWAKGKEAVKVTITEVLR